MPGLRIGIQTRSLRLPIRQALEAASQMGADGVELDLRNELRASDLSQTALRQIRKMLDDLRLKVSAVAFPTRRGYDNPNDLDRRLRATEEAMRLAFQLGARVVVNRVGNSLDEDSIGSNQLIEALAMLGEAGTRSGARLALQTGGYSPALLAKLIEKLPDGTIGADLHPANLIRGGHDPIEAVGALGPHILHVHACDAVRDFATRSYEEAELGRGAADVPALLAALQEHDYQGWITVERSEGPDPIGDAENAVAFLRSL